MGGKGQPASSISPVSRTAQCIAPFFYSLKHMST